MTYIACPPNCPDCGGYGCEVQRRDPLTPTQRRQADLSNWLDDLREFLERQQDAEYCGGAPIPNTAMRLLTELDRLFPVEEGR